ncbi:MAG TPA: hypothetical protein VFS06_18495 [Casimicrobiaceae bacterium]|nr:hypothetical protein [Casimicrobiaceae bacterium]
MPVCTIEARAVPFPPVTAYVYVELLADVVAGIESVHVVDPAEPPAMPFFVHPDTVPQFEVSVTLPPLAGSVVGDAESVQFDGCEVELQETVRFPWPSLLAVNDAQLLSVKENVAACAGTVGSAHAAATAAASTRLVRRFEFMHYLEERKR